MDWVKWLIPLVMVFVIIIANLARITQEEKKNTPRRRPGGNGDEPPRPRRPPSEVERFLEEINRRRRQSAEAPRPVAKQRAPVAPARRVTERPASRDVAPSTQDLPSVVPTARAQPAKAVPTAPVLIPAKGPAREQPLEPEGRQPAPGVQQAVPVTGAPLIAGAPAAGNVTAGAPAAVVALKVDTPTAALLRQLLRNPQALKTAFVLREVLDEPLCRRRPGGGRGKA